MARRSGRHLLALLLLCLLGVSAALWGKKAETAAEPAAKKAAKDVTKLQVGVKHRPAACDAKAADGDRVYVHYRGTLTNGEQFDASYDRGTPFDFVLGQGQVIKGWDLGVSGMCVGEKRKLKIPSDLGYGASGSPPKIPGGATLIFEVELLSIGAPPKSEL